MYYPAKQKAEWQDSLGFLLVKVHQRNRIGDIYFMFYHIIFYIILHYTGSHDHGGLEKPMIKFQFKPEAWESGEPMV